jgi:hypothetical protein
MAASSRSRHATNGFAVADTRAVTLASARAWREAMGEFVEMDTMEV